MKTFTLELNTTDSDTIYVHVEVTNIIRFMPTVGEMHMITPIVLTYTISLDS